MKTEEEIQQFCTNELSAKYEMLEALRKKTSNKFSLHLLAAILGIPLGIYCISFVTGTTAVVVFFPFLLAGIIAIVWPITKIRKEFYSVFKKEIILSIVKFYNKNLTYDPEKGIMRMAVEISKLFSPFSIYNSRDYVEGQIGETFIQFSYTEFDTNASSSSFFKGIFMIASFNKSFNGNYKVVPKKTMLVNIIDSALSNINDEMPQIIKMEDADFDKYFTVYGSDQLEARYILTPSMMQRMLDFRSIVDSNVYFSFTRSKFFLSFDSNVASIFEPSLSDPISIELITLWARKLGYAINVIDEFNLNTRIWSKH